MIPERALELVVPESEPPGAVLTGVAVDQCRGSDCNQVLFVMHQGRQECKILRPFRSLNDDKKSIPFLDFCVSKLEKGSGLYGFFFEQNGTGYRWRDKK